MQKLQEALSFFIHMPPQSYVGGICLAATVFFVIRLRGFTFRHAYKFKQNRQVKVRNKEESKNETLLESKPWVYDYILDVKKVENESENRTMGRLIKEVRSFHPVPRAIVEKYPDRSRLIIDMTIHTMIHNLVEKDLFIPEELVDHYPDALQRLKEKHGWLHINTKQGKI